MQNQTLLQMNKSKIKNNKIDNNDNLEDVQGLISLNSKFNMIYYDIKREHSILIERKLDPIKTIEGLSELNLNNNLYLCGYSLVIPEDNQGSYLFELNPLNPETKKLSDSKYAHYYPALISIKNEHIYCIGGKNQHHCEEYDIKENKWSALPNLPEERYLCTLCNDEVNNIVYLFGGINSKNHLNNKILSIEYDYFLRLKNDINYGMVWEKIEVKNNKNLLNRISAASLIFENEENYIYILGGRDEQNNLLNDVIKFNIEGQTFHQTNQRLDKPTEFMIQYPIKSNNSSFLYYFLDKFNNLIIIDKHNYVDSTFDELKI